MPRVLSPESLQQITAQASAIEEQLLAKQDTGHTLDGYINCGSTSTVFRAEGHADLVLRMPYANDDNAEHSRKSAANHVDDYVAALTPAIGHTGLEQLVAYRYEKPAMVVSIYAGPLTLTDVRKSGRLGNVGISRFRQYLTGLGRLHNLGLNSDASATNVIFNQELNPTIIDFRLCPEEPQSLREKVLEFASTGSLLGSIYNYPDKKLPPQALTFNAACRQLFGPGVSHILAEQWDEDGFKIPNSLTRSSWRDDFTTLSAKVARARYNLPQIK